MKAKAYFMAALNKILLLLNGRPTNVKRKFGCPFLSEHSCQLVSRVWLPLALLLETSSDRQYIRHLFGRPLLVL